jgi:hypothetical protein
MSLIPAEMKAEITNALSQVFRTFRRGQPIRFYKTETNTVTAFDPNFNADFEYPHTNDDFTIAAQYQDFYCKITYEDRQPYSSFVEGGEEAGVKGKFYYNKIRVKMEADAFAYLQDTERFVFFNEQYTIAEGWKRLGILDSIQFYEVILQRVN